MQPHPPDQGRPYIRPQNQLCEFTLLLGHWHMCLLDSGAPLSACDVRQVGAARRYACDISFVIDF